MKMIKRLFGCWHNWDKKWSSEDCGDLDRITYEVWTCKKCGEERNVAYGFYEPFRYYTTKEGNK